MYILLYNEYNKVLKKEVDSYLECFILDSVLEHIWRFKMRKALSILAVAIISATMVFAGGSGESSSNSLRFMWWGGDARNAATIDVINKYMEENPGIQIAAEINSDSGYIDKVAVMLSSGTAPDIMQQNVDAVPDFVSRGDFFVDLKQYPELFDTSGFDPAFLESFGTFDGKLLAVPTGISGLAMIANNEAAEVCGIDLTKQITWDNMLEDGARLHQEHPDYYYLNVDTRILTEYVLRPYLRQITGKKFIEDETKTLGFTRDQLVDALSYIDQCYKQGVFQPASESATFKQQIQNNPAWMNGKFVFGFAASSNANLLMEAIPGGSFTAVKLPLAEDRVTDGYFVDTPQYMTVYSGSKNIEEAIKFLNYFYNNPEAQAILKDVRSVPPTSTARAYCAENGILDPVIMQAVDYAQSMNGTSDKGLSTNPEVIQIQEDAIESVAYGTATPEAAADQAIVLLEDFLSRQ